MMLRTGSKKRAFTLVEVLVATAILSLGSILIFEAFYTSIDAFSYYSNYLNAAAWADQKIWQTQNDLTRFGLAQSQSSGIFTVKNKNFQWNLNYSLTGSGNKLYKINLAVSWRQWRRDAKLLRSRYAIYEEG